MRRIVTAVRSLIDRVRDQLPAGVDILFVSGYLGIAYFISLYDWKLAVGWLVVVAFLLGFALEVDGYRRQRSGK